VKDVKVEIKGTSPLLMHSYPMVAVENIEKKTIEEQAELASYRDVTTKKLYVPGICLQRALIAAASFSKGKGRATLQKNTAAGVLISPEHLDLGIKTYEIDSRPVVVPATKGRVMRHRPRLNDWKLSFTLEYDENLLTSEQIRRIVDDCGSRVGILDFRPEKKGPFGKFSVVRWLV